MRGRKRQTYSRRNRQRKTVRADRKTVRADRKTETDRDRKTVRQTDRQKGAYSHPDILFFLPRG